MCQRPSTGREEDGQPVWTALGCRQVRGAVPKGSEDLRRESRGLQDPLVTERSAQEVAYFPGQLAVDT